MKPLHLFEGFGIELEYMIVDKDTMNVLPITDKIFHELEGKYVSDIYRGRMEWSNELVLHVIELKTSKPDPDLKTLPAAFTENIKEINSLLAKHNAVLLPGAMHPFMNPFKEMHLWPHDNKDIYEVYNNIFDCRGHGWSNLQSMHINLPFADDEEFGKLHAAIRLLLPIIPALSAASPICDSEFKLFKDYRLEVYRHNQEKVPLIAGKVIPERAFTKDEYYYKIFTPLFEAIKQYDPNDLLKEEWLNSRGAIARWDRNAIEIRIIDVQECAGADIAIASLVTETLKSIVAGKFIDFETQKNFHENDLGKIFLEVIREGEETLITDEKYLSVFGFQSPTKAIDIWKYLLSKIPDSTNQVFEPIQTIFEHGTLSTRILNAVNGDYSRDNLKQVYLKLANCLSVNRSFVPSLVVD